MSQGHTERTDPLDVLAAQVSDVDLAKLFNRTRALIGPPPEDMTELARAAMRAIEAGTTPTAEQLQALEVACRVLRPAPMVRNGALESLDDGDAQRAFPDWETFRTVVQPHLGAVGAISYIPPNDVSRQVATGFLVDAQHLVTNQHVADLVTFGTGRITSDATTVRFGGEYEGSEPPAIALVEVRMHPDLDVAVFTLTRPYEEATPFPLPVADTAPAPGEPVATIGFPTSDPWVPMLVEEHLDGHPGVKRGSPGIVRQVRHDLIHHDCTTIGGSSGSPLLSMRDGRLLGVHAEGWFRVRNRAVTADAVRTLLAADR